MMAAPTAVDAPPAVGDRLTPTHWVGLLILGSFLARLALGTAVGLGIDESYMVGAGRALQWGYFDHPPASWWLAWVGQTVFQSDAPGAVRFPFILLFAATTWLLYRLTARLYGARAGLWAAVALNLSPVFAITTGGWVLPDGPLECALLGAVLSLTHALEDGPAARRWWLAAGLAAGLALFSKYSAALTLAGTGFYLLTQPDHRRWLARPEPWLAGLVALAVFSPVIAWNATHGWVSFLFQGTRAGAVKFHPFAPLTVLGGEALFVLPWIWLPMILLLVRALRRGPANQPDWLLACLAVPPILLFAVIALWSPRVLFHWAAPGYLMLFPLLGRQIAAWLDAGRRAVRAALWATAGLTAAAALLIVGELSWPFLPTALGATALREQAMSWQPIEAELAARHLAILPLAGIRWHECGKLAYALGADNVVLCLTPDAREFAFSTDPAARRGSDILIIAPRTTLQTIDAQLASRFSRIEPLAPIRLGDQVLPLYLGHAFK